MAVPEVASRQRWLGARLALLAGEKELGGAGLCPGFECFRGSTWLDTMQLGCPAWRCC